MFRVHEYTWRQRGELLAHERETRVEDLEVIILQKKVLQKDFLNILTSCHVANSAYVVFCGMFYDPHKVMHSYGKIGKRNAF